MSPTPRQQLHALLARKQMLNLFNLAGEPELVGEYRRKLASALY